MGLANFNDLISRLDENVKAIQERDNIQNRLIESNTRSIEKLTLVIVGDAEHRIKGLAERIEDTEGDVSMVNKIIDNIKAIKWFFVVFILGGIGSFASFIYFMLEVLDHIKK